MVDIKACGCFVVLVIFLFSGILANESDDSAISKRYSTPYLYCDGMTMTNGKIFKLFSALVDNKGYVTSQYYFNLNLCGTRTGTSGKCTSAAVCQIDRSQGNNPISIAGTNNYEVTFNTDTQVQIRLYGGEGGCVGTSEVRNTILTFICSSSYNDVNVGAFIESPKCRYSSTVYVPQYFCDAPPNSSTNDSGEITLLPYQYLNNLDLYWTISPTSFNIYTHYISIYVSFVSTESCCDYVDIYNGPNMGFAKLARLAGNSYGYTISNATSPSLYVHFHTDYSVIANGFTIIWTVVPRSNTNSTGGYNSTTTGSTLTTGGSGSFNQTTSTSGGGIPSTTSTSTTGSYTTGTSSGSPNTTTTSRPTTTTTGSYNTTSTSTSTTGSTTTTSRPTTSTSTATTSTTTGSYNTTSTSTSTTGSYTTTTTGPTPGSYCSGTTVLTTTTGSIVNEPYTNYANCFWIITPSNIPANSFITLTIVRFGLESGYDFVRVYDGYTLIATFSTATIGATINSTGPAVTINFRSDGSYTGTGFTINWAVSSYAPPTPTPTSAPTPNPTQTPGGQVCTYDGIIRVRTSGGAAYYLYAPYPWSPFATTYDIYSAFTVRFSKTTGDNTPFTVYVNDGATLGLTRGYGVDIGPNSSTYLHVNRTGITPPYSLPYGGAYESSIWRITQNNTLIPQWINSDGSTPTTHLIVSAQTNYLFASGVAYNPYIGGSTEVFFDFIPSNISCSSGPTNPTSTPTTDPTSTPTTNPTNIPTSPPNNSSCSGVTYYNGTSGIIANQPYGNNAYCTWVIQPLQAPINSYITIRILDLDLEPGYDFLSIYNGPSILYRRIARLSNIVNEPDEYTTTGPAATLLFTSDGIISSYRGFVVYWYLTVIRNETSYCNGNGEFYDGRCHCYSGYASSSNYDCDLEVASYCPKPVASASSTINPPSLSNAFINSNTLYVNIYSAVVANRTISTMDVGTCSNWNISKYLAGCNDVYSGGIPLNVFDACNVTRAEDQDFIYYTVPIDFHTNEIIPVGGYSFVRTLSNAFSVEVRLPKRATVGSNVTVVEAPVDLQVVVVEQSYSYESKTANVAFIAFVPYAYYLDTENVLGIPNNLSKTSFYRESITCDSTTCQEKFRLSMDTSSACSLTGDYLFSFHVGCRTLPCTLANNNARVTISLSSSSFCGSVETTISVSANLLSYKDAAYTVSQRTFALGETGYFRVPTSSSQATITSASLVSVTVSDNIQINTIYPNTSLVGNVRTQGSVATFSIWFSPSFFRTSTYNIAVQLELSYLGGARKRFTYDVRTQAASSSTFVEISAAPTPAPATGATNSVKNAGTTVAISVLLSIVLLLVIFF